MPCCFFFFLNYIGNQSYKTIYTAVLDNQDNIVDNYTILDNSSGTCQSASAKCSRDKLFLKFLKIVCSRLRDLKRSKP